MLGLTMFFFGCSIPLPEEIQIRNASPKELAGYEVNLKKALTNDPEFLKALLLLARVKIHQKKYLEAEPQAEKAVRVSPFNPLAQSVLGEVYLVSGKRFRAMSTFTRAIELDPDLLPAYVGLAEAHNLLGSQEKALEILNQAIGREPRYFPAHFQMARILISQGKLDEAQVAMEKAVRIRPHDPEGTLLGVRIFKRQGRLTLAMHQINQFLALHPENPAMLRELAELYYQRQKWKLAEKTLDKIKGRGTVEDTLLRLEVLKGNRKFKAANKILKKLGKENAGHPAVLVVLGREQILRRNYDSARSLLEKAVEANPKSVEAYFWKAQGHFLSGQESAGDASLSVAVQLAPHHPHVRLLQAQRALASRKLDLAGKILDEFLKERPANGGGLLLKSEWLALVGKYNQAEGLLDELSSGQDNPAAAYSKARLAYLKKAFNTTVRLLNPLVKTRGKRKNRKKQVSWRVIYLQAAALGQLKKYQRAIKLLGPYLKNRAAAGVLHRLRGDMYYLSGNRVKAEKTFQDGMAMNDRQPLLIEALSRLAMETGKWAQARSWLETGVEQSSPLKAQFLERLSQVYTKLKRPQQARGYLLRYLAETDPLIREQREPAQISILFGWVYPAVDLDFIHTRFNTPISKP